MKQNQRLNDSLERELARLRTDPMSVVGFGRKAYMPYHISNVEGLVGNSNPRVTQVLHSDALNPEYEMAQRLAAMHIMSQRDDPEVDDALLDCLGIPALRATAAYLLGRIGGKGYPRRSRATAKLLEALRPHLDEASSFLDPWYGESYAVVDFVIGAYIRLAGPERFRLPDADAALLIGWELPCFDSKTRDDLRSQCRRVVN